MFLKSLQLRGFKTFSDQTEIEFAEDARITGIVGPNGCGKSNLLDATRWVIGEDNPRELRVASLSSIIFAGTAARKALSLAEVTMVFDNSAGRLPMAFAEVAIKRRAFREGESEFFINKSPCRLKDIQDLLLDTGLGENTYSIITQGQVDAILSSKGDERRAVFEEAAGINKYKVRKQAAERKLIAAEQNILRISDLKIEVAEHLITLEEQAGKAEEYLAVQAKVKQLDMAMSQRLLKNLLEKKAGLAAELALAKQAVQTKQAAAARDLGEINSLKDQYRQTEQALDALAAKLDQEKDRLRDIDLDVRFTSAEISREEKALADLLTKEHDLAGKIETAKALLTRSVSRLDLSGQPEEQILNQLFQLLAALANQLSEIFAFFGHNNRIGLTLGETADKREAYQLKLEMLEEEAKRFSEEKERLDFALQAHQSQLRSLTEKQQAGQGKQALVDDLLAKKQAREDLALKISGLEDKIQTKDQADEQAAASAVALEISLAKIDGELNAVRERFSLEYNLNLDELAEPAVEIKNFQKTRSEIEAGKARLRALEPVNLLAIEERQHENERLSFINAQLADLNTARENLASLIKELDLKAEEEFVRTMKQLSLVFSEIFAKLFVGGEARISLAAGAAALESEIEISVRPSGRKWLPLPQLSGGERSLSAIAILFSLLKIRPSPFCFLDEVDAALDDANIGRFTLMLKEFSGHSQILVITHNKNTMAVADNIYGITMEEPGVSKVISMKLSQAVV